MVPPWACIEPNREVQFNASPLQSKQGGERRWKIQRTDITGKYRVSLFICWITFLDLFNLHMVLDKSSGNNIDKYKKHRKLEILQACRKWPYSPPRYYHQAISDFWLFALKVSLRLHLVENLTLWRKWITVSSSKDPLGINQPPYKHITCSPLKNDHGSRIYKINSYIGILVQSQWQRSLHESLHGEE